MKQFIVKHKKAGGVIGLSLLIAVTTLSFQDTPYVNQILNEQKTTKDTVPQKRHSDKMTMKEFDQLSKELDGNMLMLGEQLKKIDLDQVLKEVELSIKAIDMDKIMKDVELSLKEIDIEKITADAMASIKDVDWDKTNAEMQSALKEAKEEMEKAKIEMKKINTDEIKKEMANAKLEMENSRIELKEELKKIDMDKIMKEATEGMEHAKSGLKEIKTMFNEMEAEGLIDPKKGFKIEYKNKDLFINGEKQNQSVTDKYKKYFKDEHFEIEIEKE